MPSLAPYRRVLARPGAIAFSLSGLLARMPMSMASIGIVLLVQGATGNYRTAGIASAAYTVGEAGLGILQGRLIDRHGQGRVLRVTGPVFGLALGLMIWAVHAHRPLGWVYVLAAAGGGTLPSIGSSVRARWTHLLAGSGDLSTAFALEGVVDEVVFMIGPIVVTLLATLWSAAAGLGTAVVACMVGTVLFASQRATEPPVHAHDVTTVRPAMPWRVVGPLGVVSLALGMLFGATEVATIAFTDEHGHRDLAGVVLAAWSIGSMASGIVVGSVAWRTRARDAGAVGFARDGGRRGAPAVRRLAARGRRAAVPGGLGHRPHDGLLDLAGGVRGARRPAHRGDGAAVDGHHRRRRARGGAGGPAGRPRGRLHGVLASGGGRCDRRPGGAIAPPVVI